MDATCRCMFGAEVSHASWLYFLHYCNAAGGIEPLISADSDESGQEFKIKVMGEIFFQFDNSLFLSTFLRHLLYCCACDM